MRSLAVALALVLATALAAPAQAASDRLTPERFAALDAAYSALVSYFQTADRGAFVAACNTLDRADPLLAINRSECLLVADFIPTFFAYVACKTRPGCLRVTGRLAGLVAQGISLDRRLNRIVRREVAPGACRNVLRASASDVADNKRLLAALRALQRALRCNDTPAVRRAQRRIDAVLQSDGKSPAQQLEEFRAACAPATGW